MKITKQRLKEIIIEEAKDWSRKGQWQYQSHSSEEKSTFEMSEDELTGMATVSLRAIDKEITNFASAIARLVEQHEGGDFVALQTHISMLHAKLDDVRDTYTTRLGYYANRNKKRG
tara:strand:+ start:348 stop:695 length:348 start_codon:yes stop_codon:yes gene_type:complete